MNMIQEGSVYRFLRADDDECDLWEIEAVNDDGFDPDNHTIEVRNIETDEWYSHYRDVFGNGFEFVAESVDALDR